MVKFDTLIGATGSSRVFCYKVASSDRCCEVRIYHKGMCYVVPNLYYALSYHSRGLLLVQKDKLKLQRKRERVNQGEERTTTW